MVSLLRTSKRHRPIAFSASLIRCKQPLDDKFSPKLVSTATVVALVAIGIIGGISLLLVAIAGGLTVASLLSRRSVEQLLAEFANLLGGWNVLLIALAIAFSLSFLAHAQPAYALFDGAKEAASSGIGTYIGEEESTSLIDTITFGMWALAAVGGIATIAGGAIQNVLVLVGGLVLFFGMAVLIGVLEFTDGLLFST